MSDLESRVEKLEKKANSEFFGCFFVIGFYAGVVSLVILFLSGIMAWENGRLHVRKIAIQQEDGK